MLNIRLPEELERKLAEEAEQSRRSRSEIAREALSLYLRAHRRQRYINRLRSAASTLRQAEAIAIAEESLPLDEESLAIAESAVRYDNDDKWWK
ncbi:MAG TPA: ribbon-helix-helix protein, CopG family [Gammaproteobacteria bacterium]|nr:ribbon-helix-helix protein, CopG family [Gammaproteobacteria bacterium]